MDIELNIGNEENLDLRCYKIENGDVFQPTDALQQHVSKSSRKLDRFVTFLKPIFGPILVTLVILAA